MDIRTIQSLRDAVERIERCLASEQVFKLNQIKIEIDQVGNYDTIKGAFTEGYGISLAKYMRRRMLTVIYYNLQDGEKINTLAQKYGINNIPYVFKREFGLSINTCELKIENLQPPINPENEICHYLIPRISNINEYTRISTLNDIKSKKKCAYYLYSLRPYIVHKTQVGDILAERDSERAIKTLVISLNNTTGYAGNIPKEMIQTAQDTYHLYDWSNPQHLANSYVAYTPKISEELKEVFKDNLDAWIDELYPCLPDMFLAEEHVQLILALKKTKNLEEISSQLHLADSVTRELLIRYLDEGVLRTS